MKKKKNTGIQDLNKFEKIDNINTINKYLETLRLVYKTLMQTVNRQNKTIKDLKKKINKIESNKNFWYNKCQEYEKILFENKIPYEDLPF